MALSSCNDSNYMLYDTEAINRVYFELNEFNFIYGAREDLEVDMEIPIKLIGFANLENNAPFEVVIDAFESTAKEGVHYSFVEKPIFMKDSTIARVRLNFHKENLVKNVEYELILTIGDSEQYLPANKKKCIINFGDTFIEQPDWWMADRLGTYSQEKLVMFIRLFKESKEITPVVYDAIALLWGEYLDNEAHDRYQWLLTTYVYTSYFRQYFYTPMYEYYLETGDERYAIPNPAEGDY